MKCWHCIIKDNVYKDSEIKDFIYFSSIKTVEVVVVEIVPTITMCQALEYVLYLPLWLSALFSSLLLDL